MKKIVTMVGTSLFENYIEDNKDENFKDYIDSLRDRGAEEYEGEKKRINYIRNKLEGWFSKKEDKINISAEIKSLAKLMEELKDTSEIYLLYSDTVLSRLAGEFLKEKASQFLELNGSKVHCEVISDLQVKDRQKFTRGMVNLIKEIYNISGEYWKDVVINITGGYKATIPYLTILGQVNRCPIYYIFENTDALIEIPHIPLNVDWTIFGRNKKFFIELEEEGIKEVPSGIFNEEEVGSLLERVDNLIELNPLGITLWEKYKEQYDIFFISKFVKEDLDKNDNEYKGSFKGALKKLKEEIEGGSSNPDLHHTLKGLDTKGFECFKVRGSRIRLLYKKEEKQTRYGSTEIKLYIGSVAIESEVHNSNDEYIEKFRNDLNSKEIEDFNSYIPYKIERR